MKDIKDIVIGKRMKGFTDFELRTIVTNEQFLKNTTFYRKNSGGTFEVVGNKELEGMGISLQND